MNRRKFLKRIGLVGAGVAVAPSVLVPEAPSIINLPDGAHFTRAITLLKADRTPLDVLCGMYEKRKLSIDYNSGKVWGLAEEVINIESSGT